MTTPLSHFRDLTCLLFRVVDPNARFEDVDRLVHKLHDVLSDSASTPRPSFFEPILMQELMRPPTPPTLVIHPDQKAEPIPSADVQRPEAEPSTVRNVVVNLPPTTVHAVKLGAEDETDSVATPDDDGDSVVEETVDSDSEEDASVAESESTTTTDNDEEDEEEAEEQDEEEEAEEEEDITLLKIKKDKYYWSPTSKRVYEYLDEGYGDCIGTYVDGKIVPK